MAEGKLIEPVPYSYAAVNPDAHECSPPALEPMWQWKDGTRWQCDCGVVWTVWSGYKVLRKKSRVLDLYGTNFWLRESWGERRRRRKEA